MYKGKFWAILLYKYAGENGHPKDLQTQICVAFALGQKRQKPVAYFFICQDGKTATQKPTTRISVVFALGQKLQKNLFETNFKI